MRLTIELTPDQEAKLLSVAQTEGLELTDLAQKIVVDHLPELDAEATPEKITPLDAENEAAIALLQSWKEEDATDDPEEIRKANEEYEELKRGLNANRVETGERLVYL